MKKAKTIIIICILIVVLLCLVPIPLKLKDGGTTYLKPIIPIYEIYIYNTEMPNLKPYYQVKLTLLRCKLSFLENPPKTEGEQYAYDIIQKAYEINEKKIEMLDFDKNKKLLEDYYRCLDSRRK
ncbi:MAG: hypothetical protein J6B54_05650 [Clostridia bacterium]|nr:hypothetical protein [Clostridia bacterium]